MKISYLAACGVCVVALATCCPTLWIQVSKTDPAPWPEVPTPQAQPPRTPVKMQNRFDVFEQGHLTRRASDYADVLDPHGRQDVQITKALHDRADILSYLHQPQESRCTTYVTATTNCYTTGKGVAGAARDCQQLVVDAAPPAETTMVWVATTARAITSIDPRKKDSRFLITLSESLDDIVQTQEQPLRICYQRDLAKPLFSFVHASDIQLRDPSVILTDRRISKRLDWFEPLDSFEYDEDLAFYNQYVLESMVATINAGTKANNRDATQPSFVIHTGDSIDSNMQSELLRFHRDIDRLEIPFFELFGNHDMLVFGNLTPTDAFAAGDDTKCSHVASLIGHQTSLAPEKICVDERVVHCATCTSEDHALVASSRGHATSRKTFIDLLRHALSQPAPQLPLPVEAALSIEDAKRRALASKPMYCSDPAVAWDTITHDHGFDLNADRGYYAFVSSLDNGAHALFVALNSEELPEHEGGITGHISHAQLDWLKRLLGCVATQHPHDLVFVFAHQPLSMLEPAPGDETVDDVLRGHDQVIAYLYGHHHRNEICGDTRPKQGVSRVCTRFWEIQTGSLVEFPQEMRMVRIKQFSDHVGFLEVSTFGEELVDRTSQMAKYVDLAHRGAERDHCVTHAARCSDDKRVYREDGNATAARLFFPMP